MRAERFLSVGMPRVLSGWTRPCSFWGSPTSHTARGKCQPVSGRASAPWLILAPAAWKMRNLNINSNQSDDRCQRSEWRFGWWRELPKKTICLGASICAAHEYLRVKSFHMVCGSMSVVTWNIQRCQPPLSLFCFLRLLPAFLWMNNHHRSYRTSSHSRQINSAQQWVFEHYNKSILLHRVHSKGLMNVFICLPCTAVHHCRESHMMFELRT